MLNENERLITVCVYCVCFVTRIHNLLFWLSILLMSVGAMEFVVIFFFNFRKTFLIFDDRDLHAIFLLFSPKNNAFSFSNLWIGWQKWSMRIYEKCVAGDWMANGGNWEWRTYKRNDEKEKLNMRIIIIWINEFSMRFFSAPFSSSINNFFLFFLYFSFAIAVLIFSTAFVMPILVRLCVLIWIRWFFFSLSSYFSDNKIDFIFNIWLRHVFFFFRFLSLFQTAIKHPLQWCFNINIRIPVGEFIVRWNWLIKWWRWFWRCGRWHITV